MARSTSLFILLTALVIQVVLAGSDLPVDQFYIKQEDEYLSFGRVRIACPPPDLPALVLGSIFASSWSIEAVKGGYTIKQLVPGFEYSYGLLEEDERPIFSVEQDPGTWAISPAGDGLVTIGLAGHNLLLTRQQNRNEVFLKPADDSSSQKWSLTKDLYNYHSLYPNRFQHIL
ncbi:hypothetical protein BGZ70_002543 [Mortierella alpina]|uniref:Ricin B lectin domain-containing protein n=1 Tax=Mortierella alpina TaxID=64518 RepID=A0A9P6IU07_MORAP|nr:hypothetical protein BGZ70_002543 [Mortierella alpina]